ncbi:superoxide dismutase family protein [Pontibacillus yanchengensis]|uniref:Superoxide dismutase [Cu-Zn] n=1 Tax=Pontibacillus yanchengensis Y32 TaxID=1385514 RepID=A0A0A2T919_9BACI|nr:superoxide dismutase family protein [Pontibacillus yanchengensis]KGP72059.1 superoxide dismutase [Pontibacillus yanchengensis Y32]
MRKTLSLFGLAAGLLLIAGCNTQNRSALEIEMYNNSDDSLGTATLTEGPDGVNIKLSLTGLTPGLHGIHVHEFPKCESPDFKSAGGHLNPDGKEHGLMDPKGAHLGDMPNIEADEDGTVKAEVSVKGATLKDGKKSLLRNDGTSLIIHEGVDDGLTQPAGDAGERVACGKIQVAEAQKQDTPSDPSQDGDEKKKEES